MNSKQSLMGRSKQSRAEKFASYSAMAGAFLLMGTDADAEIIYVDIIDYTLEIGGLVTADIDGDGYSDMIFQATSTGSSWSFARVFGSVTSYTIGGPTNAFVGYSGPYLPYGSALTCGDPIGPAAGFIYNSGNQVFLASVYAGVTYGAFADETNKYLGFQFSISGETHYGWMRLDATVDPVSITIKDWAYETIPDEPIAACDVAAPAPEVSFTTDAVIIDESAGIATITVSLSESADLTVDVALNDVLTTATDGDDFNYSDPSPITFILGGATTQSFTVDITDDLFDETDETIVLDLASPVGGILAEPDQVTITINDNDGPPGISYTAASASIDEDATTFLGTIAVDVTADCSVDLTVNDALSTATNGADFNFTSPLTLTFTGGGATSLDFNVDILEDADVESDETVVIDLGGVTGGCILETPDQFTLTITNEDAPPPPSSTLSITQQHVTYDEDAGIIEGTVEISETNDCTVDVVFEPFATTAEAEDYVFTDPTPMTFTTGGPLTQTYDVAIVDDLESESVEIINFKLDNVTGNCTIDDVEGTMMLHIIDNDEVGIENIDGKAAIIYSFENTITIQIMYTGWSTASMNVFDNTGKQVFTSGLYDAENKFTMNDLPAGIYIVQLIIDGKQVQKNIYIGEK